MLPGIHDFVVVTNGWLTDRDFSNFFALAQTIPGPNMILMMGLIGWKVAGIAGAVAGASATTLPPCAMYFVGYRLWDRFRDATWQKITRVALAPLTFGLIIAGGSVMAHTADKSWPAVGVTIAAMTFLLVTRRNPLWMLGAAAALGAAGVV